MTPRIVSLLPSATEIVCALGFADAIVGRSHECDFPEDITDLPVCTAPKVGGATTRDIHASVSAVLATETAVYDVDANLLRDLAPTHVVTQVQCDVCAVSLRDVEAALADWRGPAPRVVTLNSESLDEVFEDIRRTAAALCVADRGERIVTSMRRRMDEIRARVQALTRPRVATIEWMEPLMAGGNWIPTLVDLAGGIDVLGKAGAHSPWMTWEQLVDADADVIVVLPCGFDIAAIRRDWNLLAVRPEWASLRAVRDGRAFVANGNQFFNRPGPRLAEAVEILAEILHPQVFDFGHEGKAWQRAG